MILKKFCRTIIDNVFLMLIVEIKRTQLLLGATPATIPSVYWNFFSIYWIMRTVVFGEALKIFTQSQAHAHEHLIYISTCIGIRKVDTTMNFSNFSTFATASSSSNFLQLLQIFQSVNYISNFDFITNTHVINIVD